MKSQAQQYADQHPMAYLIMTALDGDGFESDQNWQDESTTWHLTDGSSVVVCGNEVTVID